MDGMKGISVAIRRVLGINSPMNVWKRQFTDFSLWLMPRELPKCPIGSTITIKRPARYMNALEKQ